MISECVSASIASIMFMVLFAGCGDVDPTWPPPEEEGLCSGACEGNAYTDCTCGADDPCGWGSDGYCDAECYLAVGDERFDDGADCEGACGGLCSAFIYTACTCGPEDPCGWAGDDGCDEACLTIDGIETMFDDSADCIDACDGECNLFIHTPCTCSPDDPCGWAEDGICDIACLELEGVDEMFDDSVDCQTEGEPLEQ